MTRGYVARAAVTAECDAGGRKSPYEDLHDHAAGSGVQVREVTEH